MYSNISCLASALVDSADDEPVRFSGMKEAFWDGIIPAVAFSTHALVIPCSCNSARDCRRRIDCPIGMPNQALPGLRFHTAISNASFTNLALMCSAIDQPTTARIQINHYRQVQPAFQRIDISDVANIGLIGLRHVNCRSKRFGAMGSLWLEFVVAMNFRLSYRLNRQLPLTANATATDLSINPVKAFLRRRVP